MPMLRAVVVAAIMLSAFAGTAPLAAQDQPPSPMAEPGPDDGRFSFHRVQDNFVRLDGRTGQVSVCGREATGWACRAVPDERTALEEAIGRLQSQNATLKRELLAKGLPLPEGMRPDGAAPSGDAAAGKPPGEMKLPSDAEVDRMIGFMGRVWKRLVEMMADFQRDMQQNKS
jgi:hypothetical protein